MKLEELKAELDTDARKRCAAQEQTIKDLEKTIKGKDNLIDDLVIQIALFQKRCYTWTRGLTCSLCRWEKVCYARNKANKKEAVKP